MQRFMRLTATAAVLAATVAATTAVADRGGDDHGPAAEHGDYGLGRSYTVGLFGDMPYGAAGRTEYPRLLADMNRARARVRDLRRRPEGRRRRRRAPTSSTRRAATGSTRCASRSS